MLVQRWCMLVERWQMAQQEGLNVLEDTLLVQRGRVLSQKVRDRVGLVPDQHRSARPKIKNWRRGVA